MSGRYNDRSPLLSRFHKILLIGQGEIEASASLGVDAPHDNMEGLYFLPVMGTSRRSGACVVGQSSTNVVLRIPGVPTNSL
jgi:hypothetical protein